MLKKSGLIRNTMDKFYTKEFIVANCMDHIDIFLDIKSEDILIEPSAGNGSFVPYLKRISKHNLFIDIEPDSPEITKQDYLTLDTSSLTKKYSRIHVIGNPPFGRQSSLAIKFIKKSCEFCSSVSFILPKSFRKESMQSYFPLDFHLLHELDLPSHSFSIDGTTHDVPCVFQIWERKDTLRAEIQKPVAKGFEFVKKEDSPHISLRRVGGNAGTISEEISNKNIQTHYFIRFMNKLDVSQNVSSLKNVSFTENNTVGPKSISKPEVTREFNKYVVD
jgi:predicted RNA methylase